MSKALVKSVVRSCVDSLVDNSEVANDAIFSQGTFLVFF